MMGFRRQTATLLAGACAALLLSAPAADVSVGVADDRKLAEDGGAAFFASMRDVGLTENRITLAGTRTTRRRSETRRPSIATWRTPRLPGFASRW